MRRLAAVLAVALLLIAWQPSPGKALPPPDEQDDDTPRYSQPSLPGEQEDDPSWPGLPLSPAPPSPEEPDAPVTPLPGSPPPPEESDAPAPAAPLPPRPRRAHLPPPRQDDEPETPEPPRQRPAPSPPREPTPPRTVVPPQEPGWAAVPLPLPPTPAPGRPLNYSATGWTTMLVFGDSTVDPGNNNRLQTVMRANFLPYGASFLGGRPTGRFSNGRLITDILGTDTLCFPCICSTALRNVQLGFKANRAEEIWFLFRK